MFATSLWHVEHPFVQWGVVVGASVVCAATDLHSRRIPNWITFPLLVIGLGWGFYEASWGGLADSFLACIVLAFPFVLLFVFAGGGAGDAKLMGALGAWLGLVNGAATLAAVCIAGVLMAVSVALARGRGKEVAGNVAAILVGWMGALLARQAPPVVSESGTDGPRAQKVPYGVAICVGVVVAGTGMLLWRH